MDILEMGGGRDPRSLLTALTSHPVLRIALPSPSPGFASFELKWLGRAVEAEC